MALDSFLVGMGIKGQDVVLSALDAVKKKGDILTGKKVNVSMATIGTANLQGYKKAQPVLADATKTQPVLADATKTQKDLNIQDKNALSGLKEFTSGLAVAAKTLKGFIPSSGGGTRAGGVPLENKLPETAEPSIISEHENKPSSERFKTARNALTSFANSAAALDPVSTVQGLIIGAAKVAGGISILGTNISGAANGVADLTNAGISLATNSLNMAKQATAANYELEKRNAATEYYGGDAIKQGAMSNYEKAGLVSIISGSFGRILPALAGEINKLSGSKDTGALARVGAGDWQSTGTDKGWMIQKFADSMGDLPPSMKLKIQASLLGSYGDEIQDQSQGRKALQGRNAVFSNQAENQTARQSDVAAANFEGLKNFNAGLNNLQLDMMRSGAGMVSVIDKMADAFKKALAAMDSSAPTTRTRLPVSRFVPADVANGNGGF